MTRDQAYRLLGMSEALAYSNTLIRGKGQMPLHIPSIIGTLAKGMGLKLNSCDDCRGTGSFFKSWDEHGDCPNCLGLGMVDADRVKV
mgnify:CR=1 FL=1